MFGCGAQNKPPTIQELVAALQTSFEEMKVQNEERDGRIETTSKKIENIEKDTVKYRETLAGDIKHLQDKSDFLEIKLDETSIMLLKDVDEKFENQDKEIESIIQSILDKQIESDDNVITIKNEQNKCFNDLKLNIEKLGTDMKNIVHETKDNVIKDIDYKIKLVRFDIEENEVNLKNENEKLICNQKNFEVKSIKFQNELRKSVERNKTENETNINIIKTKITKNFDHCETKFVQYDMNNKELKTEMEKMIANKFQVIEDGHSMLQETFRNIF